MLKIAENEVFLLGLIGEPVMNGWRDAVVGRLYFDGC